MPKNNDFEKIYKKFKRLKKEQQLKEILKMNDMDLDDFGSEYKDNANQVRPVDSDDYPEERVDEDGNKKIEWVEVQKNNFMLSGKSQPTLPSGYYSIEMSERGVIYTINTLNIDDILEFPDSMLQNVIDEINVFWTNEPLFRQYGFLHKRGYLFYGPAGTGKTMLAQQIMKYFIQQKGGIILAANAHPHITSKAIQEIRMTEPKRYIILLFEDIDSIIDHYGESHLLSLLDGESNANYLLSIATTNYPEKLDKRIVARPRRFDRVLKIDMPSKVMREIYFKEKLKIAGDELDLYVNSTDGFSFAAMSELVISVKCFNKSFTEAISIMKKLINTKRKSDDFDDCMGFK